LDETGIDPSVLDLELTEGLLMEDEAGTITTLSELKALGVAITVDDFGTGYSSLAYLKRFQLDALKIDQSFVRDVLDDSDDAAIVCAVVDLGDNLGLRVIAEGVERRDQLEFLRSRGCQEAQGFLFSRALPSHEFTEWASAWQNEQTKATPERVGIKLVSRA